ncbi:MAG: CBS domain-containing protein [Rhodospirillaceae bacterium]|nr:CBS domain-containing protein [Rhodospirillaceae bacterium]
MIRKIVPDVISGQTLHKISPRENVRAAAKMMRDKKIAAVLVMEGEALVGIITERDMTVRVLAAGIDPDTATATDIMTINPDTLSPEDTASDAISMMRKRNYRHLPVVEGTRVVGMVSVRDLYAVYNTELEQDLKDRNAFIYGESYGGMQ